MSNITLFAGAGFSRAISEKVRYCYNRELKMPLANEMFTNESSRDYLKKGYFKAYDKLADYLEGKYNSRYPKESYEDVYTQLKNERKDDIAKELENLVFENLGVNFPPIRYPYEVKRTANIVRRAIRLNKINNIITTNPDLLIDVSLVEATEFNEEFIKLFGSFRNEIELSSKNNEINNETKKWYPVVGGKCKKNTLGIKNYIKVHGSVNFVKSKGGKNIYLIDKYKWCKGISTAMFRFNNKFELCVIPPLRDKKYEEEPWKSLFEAAKEVINNTDKMIIYGFGFSENDEALIELFKTIKPDAKVEVYDINACKKHYKEKVGNYLDINIDFKKNANKFFNL